MADPVPSSSRLEDLQMRWQLDPGSRVYLQLAEEYRKLERHPEAIEVLKRGLEQRPNDLSGQVALGRCHLEMDELEPALQLLEGVIERDPAHMVGNKLLLEAYLKSGDAASAGERLELYKLLNPADPEIETLEDQLRGLRTAAPGVPEPGGVTTAEIPIVPHGEEEALVSPEPEISQEPAAGEPAAGEPAAGEPAAGEAAPPARDPAFETSPTFELPDMTGANANAPPEEAVPPAVEEPPLIDEALVGASTDETPLDEIPLSGAPLDEEPAFELVPDEPVEQAADAMAELPAAEVPEPELPAPELPEPEPALATKPLADNELFHLGPPPPPPRFEELWGWPAAPSLTESAPATELLVEEPRLEDFFAGEPAVEEPAAEEPAAEEPDAEEPAVEEPVVEEALTFEAEEVAAAPEPVAPEPVAPEPVAPEPVAPPPAPQAEEPQAEAVAAEEPATATLGALYLRQGHVSEAEKIFRQVLRQDPRNAAALAGLARIRGEKGLTAQALLASAGERVPVGLTAKKIRLLESYLKHLRNASKSHVH